MSGKRRRRWVDRGKAGPSKGQRSRTYRRSTQSIARYVPLPRQRGYLRTGGFYGRYANGGELKFHDIDVDDAAIAQNGTIQNSGTINIIPQGVTEVQRVGRKCTIRSIGWRFNITVAVVAGSGGGLSDVVRVILYLDKQANGATATITGILESDDYQSFNNLSNKSRFRTLMDRTYVVSSGGGAGDGTTNDFGSSNTQDSFFKSCNIPIEFDSTTGAITEMRSNNLGVLLLSRTGNVAGFDSKFRLRFSDS